MSAAYGHHVYPSASIVASLLLALVPAACGDAQSGGASIDGAAVTWVNRPAPRYTSPPPAPVPYATIGPACRVDQLHATGAVVGAATGNLDERFTFTNVSRSTCLLRGFPSITALAPDGRRVPLHPVRSPHGTFFGSPAPAAIPPGRHVYLDLATEDVTCSLDHPFVYSDLAFRLPDGSRLNTHTRLTRFCGGWQMSRFGLPPRTTATVPPRPGSLDTIHVALSLPSSARDGTTLRYLITLTNPTDTAVRLNPCPSYTEAIYAPGAPSDGSRALAFFLNCDTVHRIDPGGRVRFRMRLRLPALPPVQAKFSWHLNTPGEPGSGAVLAIKRGG
jgi:Protein of unknown function (DUF4232)